MQESQTTRRPPSTDRHWWQLAALVCDSLGVAELDPEWRFRWVNDPCGRFLGYEDNALLGKALREFIAPEDWQDPGSLLDPDDPASIAEIPQQRYRTRAGQEAWARVFVRVRRDDRHAVCGYLMLTVDISREKRSESRFHLALESGKIGIWQWDMLTDTVYGSKETYRLLGLPPGTRIDCRRALDCLHPDDRESIDQAVRAALAGDGHYERECRVIWPDGSEHWLLGGGNVHRDGLTGQPLRMDGMIKDISDHKHVESVLSEQQRQLAEAQAIAHIGSWVCELDGRIRWSEETYRIFGVDPTSFKLDVASFVALLHPEDRASMHDWIHGCLAGQCPPALVFRRQLTDGQLRYLNGQGSLLHAVDGQPLRMVGTVQDITRHYLAEQKLRRDEERLRIATQGADLGIWYWDLQTNRLDWSQTCRRHLAAPEGIEASLELFYSALHPDDRAHVARLLEAARQSQQDYSAEYRVIQPDGTRRWIRALGRACNLQDGRPQAVAGITQDITAQRAMEEEIRALNRDLEEKVSQRTAEAQTANAAKSRFLAHMSHEIRTPLNGVLGMAQMLAQDTLSADQHDMVEHILAAGHSMLGILNEILDLSKIEAGQLQLERQAFKPRLVLQNIISVMAANARLKGLALRLEAPADLPADLLGDALRLKQVLYNLVGNAIKFTDRGEVVLRVQCLTQTAHSARLRFEVADTGIGMDAESLRRIFTPFAQADASISRRYGGTGLGLPISQRLVAMMGGEITVASTLGRGSRFGFELLFEHPQTVPGTSAADSEATIPSSGTRLRGLRVLVADDAAINRLVVERALRREGAEVALAEHGQAALDRLAAEARDFDAVLMDIQMPVMDGLAAIRAIRENPRWARLKVIALTAGVLIEERDAALSAGADDFLSKPVDLGAMIDQLARLMPPAS